MKKILGLFTIAAFLVVLAVTHSLATQPDEVEICHLKECITPEESNSDELSAGAESVDPGLSICVGTLMTVSEKDLPAHIERGDQVDHYAYLPMNVKIRKEIKKIYGFKVPSNCDCVFGLVFGLGSAKYEKYDKKGKKGKKKIKLHD